MLHGYSLVVWAEKVHVSGQDYVYLLQRMIMRQVKVSILVFTAVVAIKSTAKANH